MKTHDNYPVTAGESAIISHNHIIIAFLIVILFFTVSNTLRIYDILALLQ